MLRPRASVMIQPRPLHLHQETLDVQIHYLEIVTSEVSSTCDTYAAALGLSFGPPVPALGGARTAQMPAGALIGVRAPLRASEQPVVRPYWLVDDIEAAVATAVRSGGQLALAPTKLGDYGTCAIYLQGGIDHGLWQR
jgi:predicted enzyme related to lactoylglutathione lyase